MLILTSSLVVVLPNLEEVESIEELDCAIEGSGNQSNVFDIFEL